MNTRGVIGLVALLMGGNALAMENVAPPGMDVVAPPGMKTVAPPPMKAAKAPGMESVRAPGMESVKAPGMESVKAPGMEVLGTLGAQPVSQREFPAMMQQGINLMKANRFREAADTFTQAINANPNSEQGWTGRGFALFKMGPANYQQAWGDFSKAIELNPKSGNAYLGRASISKANNQDYRNDLNMAAQLGNQTAQQALQNATASTAPQAMNRQNTTLAPQPSTVRNRGGNPIEPVSNGIRFDMTASEVKQRFGVPPGRGGSPSCDMDFGAFSVDVCYGGKRINRMYLNAPGLTLNSGIGVGSSRADVASIFGSPDGNEMGPYKLFFQYNGDIVSHIRIDYNPVSGGKQAGGTSAQDRNNHYSNMYQLNNRMDQSGTVGYNPFRNQ